MPKRSDENEKRGEEGDERLQVGEHEAPVQRLLAHAGAEGDEAEVDELALSVGKDGADRFQVPEHHVPRLGGVRLARQRDALPEKDATIPTASERASQKRGPRGASNPSSGPERPARPHRKRVSAVSAHRTALPSR